MHLYKIGICGKATFIMNINEVNQMQSEKVLDFLKRKLKQRLQKYLE